MKVEEIFTEEGMTTISSFPTAPFVKPKKKKKRKKDEKTSDEATGKTLIKS